MESSYGSYYECCVFFSRPDDHRDGFYVYAVTEKYFSISQLLLLYYNLILS